MEQSTYVKMRLGQVVADDAEGEGHPLQRVDGVLVGHVVAGKDDPNPKKKQFKLKTDSLEPFK